MKNHHQYSIQEDVPQENQEDASLELNTEPPSTQENQIISDQPIHYSEKPADWSCKVLAASGLIFFVVGSVISHLYAKYEPSIAEKYSPGSFQYISANLKTDPILDLQIIEHRSSCPSGLETLALNTWPGTVSGCLCDNEGLVALTCQKRNSPQCQIDVPATPPLNMYEWNGDIWCGKRAVLGKDYVKKTACPEGYKECYPGGCFLNSIKDCPITHVEISSTETTNSQKLSKASADGKDRYLILTRKQGGMPLIDLKITQNDIPCFDQNAFPTTEKAFIYPLINGAERDSCGQYGLDSHFSIKLDSQSSYETFTQNSFPKTVMELPHFETNAQRTQSVLSWKAKMKTARNDACLDLDPRYESLKIETSRWDTSGGLIILNDIATGISFMIIIIAYRCGGMEFLISGKWILFCIHLSFQTCLIAVAHFFRFVDVYKTVKSGLEYFAAYDSLGCFPEGQGNILISGFLVILKNLDICYWLSLTLFTGAGIHIFLWIVCCIRCCFLKK